MVVKGGRRSKDGPSAISQAELRSTSPDSGADVVSAPALVYLQRPAKTTVVLTPSDTWRKRRKHLGRSGNFRLPYCRSRCVGSIEPRSTCLGRHSPILAYCRHSIQLHTTPCPTAATIHDSIRSNNKHIFYQFCLSSIATKLQVAGVYDFGR